MSAAQQRFIIISRQPLIYDRNSPTYSMFIRLHDQIAHYNSSNSNIPLHDALPRTPLATAGYDHTLVVSQASSAPGGRLATTISTAKAPVAPTPKAPRLSSSTSNSLTIFTDEIIAGALSEGGSSNTVQVKTDPISVCYWVKSRYCHGNPFGCICRC